jgi:hypothetical protein
MMVATLPIRRMPMAPRRVRRRALGDAAQGVQLGGSLAVPAVTGILAANAASTAAATGSAATILGMSATAAVPIIGAALTAAIIGITALIRNSGCGPTCVVTSQWANQAEPLLKQNADAYFSLPSPRTKSQQQAALNGFDVVWERLKQLCSQPDVGNAGVRCITDRQAGACKWKATADSPWPGGPRLGECWNWFNGYRDPIQNDQTVPDNLGTSVSSAVSDIFAGTPGSGINPGVLLLGGLLLVGVLT